MVREQTGRAWLLERHGYDGLVETTRPIPQPGRNQILVRMRAASLNYRDLKILHNSYHQKPQLPLVALSDGAGEVIGIGEDVSRFKPGDRVVPAFTEGWRTGPIPTDRSGWRGKTINVDGVAQDYAVYHEEDAARIPDCLSYEEAACIPCAGVTAWHALVHAGHIKPGDTMLTMGSGGVSVAALQIARMAGARTLVVSRDAGKLQRLIDMGAAGGINRSEIPEWADPIREMTNGRGADLVVELGGTGTVGQSLRATRDGGHILAVGNLTGEFAREGDPERDIRVSPIAVGSREMTEELLRAIDLHRQMPVIDSSFPFSELKTALRRLESGQHFGKIVITF